MLANEARENVKVAPLLRCTLPSMIINIKRNTAPVLTESAKFKTNTARSDRA
jgi:hypothetical protein